MNLREKRYLRKYYLTIKELPLSNWIDFYETENPKHLSRTGKVCKRVTQVFDGLQSQLIDTFGISPNYKTILEHKIRISILKSEIALKGDRTRQIFIDKLNQKITELEAGNQKIDLIEGIIAIEKQMKFKLDTKIITVFEFYKYSKFVNNTLNHG